MKLISLPSLGLALLAVVAASAFILPSQLRAADQASATASAASADNKPALVVQLSRLQIANWPQQLSANGNISAWQEAIISAELGGQRLQEVLVNVGDSVKKGQVLARFASAAVAADMAQQQAAVVEAQAALDEANANAARANSLVSSGALSAQQIAQYLTAQKSAAARLQSAKARLQIEQIRMRQTAVVAFDDGVISARLASVGMVPQQGQELFKMLRNHRLEWRAEVNARELSQLKPGMLANLQLADGSQIKGKLRMLAPTIDPASRNALVYVDLPQKGSARAGMFATGYFELGQSNAYTLAQSAVVLRDGFAYIFALDKAGKQQQNAAQKVQQLKVKIGRRQGDKVEVLLDAQNAQKLNANTEIVSQGAAFLNDGDTVKVVGTPSSAPQPSSRTNGSASAK